MEAKRLMIGNFVNRLGEPTKITSLTLGTEMYDYISTASSGVLTSNQVEPIPLTEEWLIKFGFELMYSSDFSMKYGHSINDKFSYKFNFVNGQSWLEYHGGAIDCKYVHQLQNLYFALTGEELTLKTQS